MKVTLDPPRIALTADAATTPGPSARIARPATTPNPDLARVAGRTSPAVVPTQPTVTFRKDTAGRIYYVVTDPQSGKEIRQIPADIVRKAAEGIDEFLRQLDAKQNSHLEVKA